jgi:hypothetical protein
MPRIGSAGLLVALATAGLCTRCLTSVGDVRSDDSTGGSDASAGGNSTGAVGGTSKGGAASGGVVGGGSGGVAGGPPNGGGAAGSAGTGGVGGAGGVGGGGEGGTGATGAGGSAGCPPADNFNDGTLAPQWTTFGLGISEAQGVLNLGPPTADAFAYAGLRTASAYDLRGCDLAVEVPKVLDSKNATSVYLLWYPEPDDSGSHVTIGWQEGSLFVGRSGSEQTLAYNANEARWWRIRESAGSTHFLVSSDGTIWKELFSIVTPSVFVSGRVELGAGTWNGKNAIIGTAQFDNFEQVAP